MTKGPIIIIDDDLDDQEIYAEGIKAIGVTNEIRFFNGGQKFLDYLYVTPEQPFIILCDVNMPGMDGLQLKEIIFKDQFLSDKGIPFVFVSTNASKDAVRKAHVLQVQGYFQKPESMDEIKRMLQTLFNYWEMCKHINNT